jgi:hypothetical protein
MRVGCEQCEKLLTRLLRKKNNKPYRLLKIRWWRQCFRYGRSQILLFQPRLKSPPPVIPGVVLVQRKSKMNRGQVVFALCRLIEYTEETCSTVTHTQ